MVTADEAENLLAKPKVIGANLTWRPDRGMQRLNAAVQAEETGEMLELRGYVGQRNRSFVLLYQNVPIRKYTVHSRHKDPVTKETVTGPHKHTWDDIYEDNRVYVPNDIRIGNPDEELMDFLKECNITLRGRYNRQLSIFGSQEEPS